MKIKTNALTGRALDWAVARAVGYESIRISSSTKDILIGYIDRPVIYSPTWDWNQIPALLIDYRIAVIPERCTEAAFSGGWYASFYFDDEKQHTTNICDTPQIAICRAVVAAQLGDEVEIPDELLEEK
ncbi:MULTISPECIES: phage protein NinX family protein [Xenorhabdus]|uniref:phage protein NinX family protein n=1 Tax=Xenorhabdus TaxID=626 RepID=UPI0013649DA6|nr:MULTISPECIES: phage protein NinX family protein [Xenorhabdus]